MQLRVQIRGAREITQVLRQLPTNVQKRVLQKAARKGANVFRDAAIAKAPPAAADHDRRHPGQPHLQDAIRVTVREAKGPQKVTMAAHTGAAFWGNFAEFGTATQAATPFFRPTFDEKAGEALKVTGQELGKGVEDEARKLSGSYSTARQSLLRGRR